MFLRGNQLFTDKLLCKQLCNLRHGQKQPQRGLLERLKIKMPVKAFGPLVFRIHDHRHGRDLLYGFQAAAQGIDQQKFPDTLPPRLNDPLPAARAG